MSSRRLPNTANRSTRDFHSQANEIEKTEIIEVEEQDPSNVLLHPTEAGDPYYIGDIYDEQPLDIAQGWAIDTYVLRSILFPRSRAKETAELPISNQFIFMRQSCSPLPLDYTEMVWILI
jgi:hypothetical protein